MGRNTAPCGRPQLCAKRAKASIPVLEEVPKCLAPSLQDASSGWTVTCPIPPHASKMSAWSNFTPPPCATVRCYCGAATSHDLSTTPKVALMVNVPPHAQSSHSSEGTAQASLDHNEALEDDFQTQHTPVCHVMQWEDTGHRSSAEGKAGMFWRKPKAVDWVLCRHQRRGGNPGNS